MSNKLTLIVLVLFLFNQSKLRAQELNAQELLNNILQLKPLLDYKDFKNQLHLDISEITKNPMAAADYNALQDAYGNVKNQFDVFIGLVKQDIMDFKNIKKMSKNGLAFAEKYVDVFNAAVQVHQSELLPLITKIKGKERSFLALLLPLGKMAFDGIVKWIQNKKIDKEELMSDLLQLVNTSFVDKLKMKPWAALASSHTPTNTNNAQNNPNSHSNNHSTKRLSSVQIDYPTTKELKGSIEFIQTNTKNPQIKERMIFVDNTNKQRTLTIGTLSNTQGTNAGIFTSEKQYGEGTAFQLRTENSGLLYAFAFNSDNTCYAIYPYNQEWVKGFEMSKNRNLTISPLMLKEDNFLTIPSPRQDTKEENYITISGNSSKEQLCIILTKSELKFNDFLASVSLATGSLSQRLEQVLGKQATGYEQLNLEQGVLHFDLSTMEKPILPIIFEIRRF